MIIAEEEGGKEGGGGGAWKRREKKEQAARLVVDVAPPTLPHTGPQHGAIVLPPPEVTSAGPRRSTLSRAERREEIDK